MYQDVYGLHQIGMNAARPAEGVLRCERFHAHLVGTAIVLASVLFYMQIVMPPLDVHGGPLIGAHVLRGVAMVWSHGRSPAQVGTMQIVGPPDPSRLRHEAAVQLQVVAGL